MTVTEGGIGWKRHFSVRCFESSSGGTASPKKRYDFGEPTTVMYREDLFAIRVSHDRPNPAGIL